MWRIGWSWVLTALFIFLCLPAHGGSIGPEFRVDSGGSFQGPSVAALSGGGFVVVWPQYQIYGSVFNSAGKLVNSQFQASSFPRANHTDPSVAGLKNGGFVVAWTSAGAGRQAQDGSESGIFAQRFDAAGGKIGAEFQVNSYTAGQQRLPSVASLADGGFVIAWTGNGKDGSGHVYGKVYDNQGAPKTIDFRLNGTTINSQVSVSVSGLEDGGFVASWTSYDQDGSNHGVYARRFLADGTPRGAEFRVNQFTRGNQDQSTTRGLANGGFLIAWSSNVQDGSMQGIYCQLYDSTGIARAGREFLVNTTTAGSQTSPAGTTLSDGSFVAVWQSQAQDGSGWGIYRQNFTQAGGRIGTEYRVNQTRIGDQQHPSVAGLSAGGFVVSWMSNKTIFARQYFP